VHCQDVHGVSQRGSWPVYALISSLNDICETRGREILSRGIATLDVAMLFGMSRQPKLSYKHRIRALRFAGRNQKQTIYVVVVPHPVNRHGIYGLAYGRLRSLWLMKLVTTRDIIVTGDPGI